MVMFQQVRTAQVLLLAMTAASALFYLLFYSPGMTVNESQAAIPHNRINNNWNTSHLVAEDSAINSTAGMLSSSASFISNVSVKSTVKSSKNVPVIDTVISNTANTINVVSVDNSGHSPASNRTTSSMDNTVHGIIAGRIYEAGHSSPNPAICPDLGSDLRLLAVVMSAPSHAAARTAIRQTWGHFAMRRDVGLAFMLGESLDSKLDSDLNNEQEMYGDLIRGRFIDTYDNLTLKTISMLEWVDNYCPKAMFVLKTDDDMFINIVKLLAFITKHENARNQRIIYGRLARKWKPIRNKKSKYYVSPQQYLPATFPDFTTGPAYLLSTCVVHDLYMSALNHTYLKLEDVFTTGIVAHHIGVKRIHVNEFLNRRVNFNPCVIQKGISIHMVKYSEQFDLWKKLLDGKTKCK